MQRAADISAQGFKAVWNLTPLIVEVWNATRPGVSERYLASIMLSECVKHGAECLAYPPIVAYGTNGLTIHYCSPESMVGDSNLILMDAGCEIGFYASDVTRCWPGSPLADFSQWQVHWSSKSFVQYRSASK